MLQHLSVKNLAIVEEAEVAFGRGLNVVTGETGTGKSVLIGALSLILGERADRGLIRSGANEAAVSAHFQLAQCADLDARLSEAGLPCCEEGSLVVRRSISASGGGRCWINDSVATVATLRQLGELLVDMHGPYDHQSLLSTEFQLELLDAFGECGATLPEGSACYRAAYERWQELLRERERLQGAGAGIEAERERLQFIVDEIGTANLSEADGDDLIARHAETANGEAILELGGGVAALLLEGEGAAFDQLALAQQRLTELSRILPEAEEWLLEVRAAATQVQELGRAVSERLQRLESDAALLAELEERMRLVQRLRRKYGPTLAEVLHKLEESEGRLRELEGRSERLAALEGEIAGVRRVVEERGVRLSKARAAAGVKLARAITRELRDLGFAKAAFSVELTARAPGARGLDAIEFRFAPNLGEPAAPLRMIASSGEISRVMLAVKAVLAEHDRIPLLVFDEIDANIGGEIGRAVGRKLRTVAASHQIICITHLPQVAAYGESQYAVTKSTQGERTHAAINVVAGAERAGELARMLGGADMTKVTLEHARAMLRACQEEFEQR